MDEPLFEEFEDSFRVTLMLSGLVSTTERAWLLEFETQGRLREGDRSLLLSVMREGRVTNSRAREILGVDSVEARGHRLGRLRDAGLLVQNGTRGRAYYTPGIIGPERGLEQVIIDAAGDEPLTNERVRALTTLDRYQARQVLSRLVGEGRLVQKGQRRGTRYELPADPD